MNRTRTEAFDSIKTRQLVFQNPDGTFPPTGSIFTVAGSGGTTGFVNDISVNTIDITNANITNIETIDITATHISVQDISAISTTVETINATHITVQDISAISTTVETINATHITVQDISAISTTVETINATHITVQDISSSTIITHDISGDSATFIDIAADTLSLNDANISGSLGIGKNAQNPLDVSGSAAFTGNVSIGSTHGIHELDVSGHVFIQSDGSATKTFTQPGVHNIKIPAFVSSIDVEIIGAGGYSANGGGGGYIRGAVDVSGFSGQTLTLQVGGLGSGLCAPSSSSYLTFLSVGPLLTVAGAGGNGFNGTALGVIAAGGNGGGGSFSVSGTANGSDGAISSVNATSGRGGSTVGGAAATSPVGVLVYQTPQPGQGRTIPESYIEASGGTGGFNESCGPAGGSGYAGGGQGLFGSLSSGTFLSGGGGGGSSYVGTRVSNITSYAGGSVPVGIMSGYGRSGQNGCVRISYIDIPSLQTSGDIVCGGNLHVDGRVEGPLDVSGTLSVDVLNVRQYVSDTNYTTAISTNIVRTNGLLVGSEDPNITPAAAIHVLGGAVKVEGNISCNTLNYGTLNPAIFTRGMIMMFSGLSAPTGWAFCDGANGTPDLRDRFVVGAGSTYAQGNTGGSASVLLTTQQLPAHKHSITDPGHGHRVRLTFQTTDSDTGSGGGIEYDNNTFGRSDSATFDTGTTATGTGEDKRYEGSGDAGSWTNYTMQSYFNTTGISETQNEGGGQAHENRPPYYALAFIMKT